jgi:proline racemase
MLNTGLISLTPPKTASTGPAGAIKVRSRPRAGEWVKISLNAKDLVRVAVGEKVPVKLYQNGKLKIKVSVSARGMFFFCAM